MDWGSLAILAGTAGALATGGWRFRPRPTRPATAHRRMRPSGAATWAAAATRRSGPMGPGPTVAGCAVRRARATPAGPRALLTWRAPPARWDGSRFIGVAVYERVGLRWCLYFGGAISPLDIALARRGWVAVQPQYRQADGRVRGGGLTLVRVDGRTTGPLADRAARSEEG